MLIILEHYQLHITQALITRHIFNNISRKILLQKNPCAIIMSHIEFDMNNTFHKIKYEIQLNLFHNCHLKRQNIGRKKFIYWKM